MEKCSCLACTYTCAHLTPVLTRHMKAHTWAHLTRVLTRHMKAHTCAHLTHESLSVCLWLRGSLEAVECSR